MTRPRSTISVPRLLSGDSPHAVSEAVAALRAGQVIALPTDTVYGLAAAIDRPEAIRQLFALKDRPVEKAIPVLLSDVKQQRIVAAAFPLLAMKLAERFWPGPLTIVVPARQSLPRTLTMPSAESLRTVAVRVPAHPLARQIISAAGGAIAVTSANLSGNREALDASEAAAVGTTPPAIVVDGGPAPGGTPSTIVLATGNAPVLIRDGAIPFAVVVSTA
jgi:L-threonylcarbamoyladenylate synthase